jgi:hypothetical protein
MSFAQKLLQVVSFQLTPTKLLQCHLQRSWYTGIATRHLHQLHHLQVINFYKPPTKPLQRHSERRYHTEVATMLAMSCHFIYSSRSFFHSVICSFFLIHLILFNRFIHVVHFTHFHFFHVVISFISFHFISSHHHIPCHLVPLLHSFESLTLSFISFISSLHAFH